MMMRTLHGVFKHSALRKTELLRIAAQFEMPCRVPLPVYNIRWLGRLECLKAILKSRVIIDTFLNDLLQSKQGNDNVRDALTFLRSHEMELLELLKLLKVLGVLTTKLQKNDFFIKAFQSRVSVFFA